MRILNRLHSLKRFPHRTEKVLVSQTDDSETYIDRCVDCGRDISWVYIKHLESTDQIGKRPYGSNIR